MNPRRCLAACVVVALGISTACRSTTQPGDAILQTGRWTGDGACLSVADAGCNLTVGCGHGQFPRPTLRANGTFEIDGTYRIEAGPVSIEPAPPAHFSGIVTGSSITLTVIPTATGLQQATYKLQPAAGGTCSVPCV